MREHGVGPNGTESPGGGTLQKRTEKSRRLDHCTIWSKEKQEEHSGHGRKPPSWSTREQWRTSYRRACFPKYSQRKRKDRMVGRGSKDQDESISRTLDSRPCSSELLKGLYGRARGRLQNICVASHVIHAGIDLFIGKSEAYIMNRMRRTNRCSERKAKCMCLVSF